MKPSNEIIEKFQRIYHEEFGEEISRKAQGIKGLSHFSSEFDQSSKNDRLKENHY